MNNHAHAPTRLPRWVLAATLFSVATHPALYAANQSLIAEVPQGTRVVRAERWDAAAAAWLPVANAHLDGRAGSVRMLLRDWDGTTALRVVSRDQPLFPPQFEPAAEQRGVFVESALPDYGRSKGSLASSVDLAFAEGAIDAPDSMEIQESDILRRAGTRLYFFNQYRGLQVIDMRQPAAPIIESTLRLPARGEELYVMADGRVLLLAATADGTGSEVREVFVDGAGVASWGGHVGPLAGHYADSRLVDNTLHLLTQVWGEGSSHYQLTSIDFGVAGTPLVRGTQQYPLNGWGTALSLATQEYLFLCLPATHSPQNPWLSLHTEVVALDWRTAGGQPQEVGRFRAAGVIKDKFKLHLRNGVLTTVSEARISEGLRINQPVSVVETFDMGSSPLGTRLGSLQLAPGETLFATRFDGARLYAVTFLQKDPLFTVDLSDASNPRVIGKLDIPGFSTWLQVDGRWLVSVGVEEGRVAITLFDADNTGKVEPHHRVYIGGDNGYSWSEGNYDERAIVLDRVNQRLVLPYQTWHFGAGKTVRALACWSYASGQWVDLGHIEFPDDPPRRAQWWDNTLVAVSGSLLQTAAHSATTGFGAPTQLPIAWPVEYVYPHGGMLLQVAGNTDYQNPQVRLRVSPQQRPDQLVADVALAGGALIGAHFDAGWLSILATNDPKTADERAEITLSVWDLRDAASPLLAGRRSTPLPENAWWWGVQLAPYPHDGDVVWVAENGGGYGGYPLPWLRGEIGIGATDAVMIGRWWWWPAANWVVRTHTGNPAAPVVRYATTVAGGDYGAQFQLSWPYWFASNYNWAMPSGDSGEKYRDMLAVWDLRPARGPVRLPDIPLLGELVAVEKLGDDARLLAHRTFTEVPQPKTTVPSYRPPLQDFVFHVYDGVASYEIDRARYPHSDRYPHLLTLHNGQLVVGSSVYADGRPTSSLDVFKVSSGSHGDGWWATPPLDGYLASMGSWDAPWFHTRQGGTVTLWQTRNDAPPVTATTFELGAAVPVWAQRRVPAPDGAGWVLPAGPYGIEHLLAPAGAPAVPTSPRPARQSIAATTEWRELVASLWRLVDAAADDGLHGVLSTLPYSFAPRDGRPLLTTARDLGDLYRAHPGFGVYREDLARDWLFSVNHGWLWRATDHWLHAPDGGWLWFSDVTLPWVFDPAAGGWRQL
jgi:hypothetical protein